MHMSFKPQLACYTGQPMYAAGNPSGSVVVVAGRAIVWACLPVSLEEQAREALRRRCCTPAACQWPVLWAGLAWRVAVHASYELLQELASWADRHGVHSLCFACCAGSTRRLGS